MRQSCDPTPGQETKEPFHIPVKIGLLSKDGKELIDETVLELKEEKQEFSFADLPGEPVVSFLRDFSAPVRVQQFQPETDLAFLMANDPNQFNRWGSATALSSQVILAVAQQLQTGEPPHIDDFYLDAVEKTLSSPMDDKALTALALQLPTESTLAQEMRVIYPKHLRNARTLVKSSISRRCMEQLVKLYHENISVEPYNISPAAKGRRSLKNVCLSYLMALNPLPQEIINLSTSQYANATNMTDTMAALSLLVHVEPTSRIGVLEDFYTKWKDDALVLDKWFAVQALSELPGVVAEVRKLMEHPAFSIKNPNKVRALVGTFCSGNHAAFHNESGDGYRFLSAQIVALNKINPQIAARLLSPMINWKRYEPRLRDLMKKELQAILNQKDLSRDVFEIVSNSLV